MARNRSFTGSRKSVGTPTLNKSQYFQLIRKIRNAATSMAVEESGKTKNCINDNNMKKEKTQ